jgi:alkylation response protein AidB-like acyl-CoA dehydrogenase
MDASERALLEQTIRDAIAAPPGNRSLDAVLADLGWLEMLHTEPRDAQEIVFTALGATNRVASVLDDVVVAALGAEPRPDLAVLLPRFTTWDPPGRIDGDDVVTLGLGTARAATATAILVVSGVEPDLRAVRVARSALDVSPVAGIDPDAGLYVVRVYRDASDEVGLDNSAWEAAVAAGRRALAHQLAGASRGMLDLARTHALERVQFGRPIASFQAVRHRLAETLVAIEALDATLTAAWDAPSPMTAALAKAVAGCTVRTAAEHCQQILAGVGFTTDHPFHGFLKRSMALEGLFGRTDEIVVDIGHQLLGARAVPTLIEL